MIDSFCQYPASKGTGDRNEKMPGMFKFMLNRPESVMIVGSLMVSVSDDVLDRIHVRFRLNNEGEEDFKGMQEWCSKFYRKYYDHEETSLDEWVLGREKDKWNKAALEMLLDFNVKIIEESNSSGSDASRAYAPA